MEHNAVFEQLLNKKIENKICRTCGLLRENDVQSICPQCGEFFSGKELTIIDCLVVSRLRLKPWKGQHFSVNDAYKLCLLSNSKLSSQKNDFIKYCEESIEFHSQASIYLKRLDEKF